MSRPTGGDWKPAESHLQWATRWMKRARAGKPGCTGAWTTKAEHILAQAARNGTKENPK